MHCCRNERTRYARICPYFNTTSSPITANTNITWVSSSSHTTTITSCHREERCDNKKLKKQQQQPQNMRKTASRSRRDPILCWSFFARARDRAHCCVDVKTERELQAKQQLHQQQHQQYMPYRKVANACWKPFSLCVYCMVLLPLLLLLQYK